MARCAFVIAAAFLVVLMTSQTVDGKRFSRCELVSKFTEHQIPQSQLRDLYLHSRGGRGENHFRNPPPSTPNRDSNYNILLMGSLVHHESEALDHVATGAGLCLSEKESGMDSGKVGGPNKNGSFDYGIFQINGKYWCKKGKKGGDCNIDCDAHCPLLSTDLINSNIDDDIECAKKIYKRHGFSAWVALEEQV
ncbi:unnamed protein product [Timema podura]|uniref:lysozyme n=1 Tax=Timema podura TaxID=61482 RepID=A0ABN7NKI3_TIMPD|nr:unnamed protein product [Timema podura]